MPALKGRGLLLASAILAATASAYGQQCTSPWVRVSVTGVDPARAGDFLRLLRAELAARHIDVCEAGSGDPIATIDLSANEDGANLDVEVHDALTAKRVRRDVPLASLPPDGVPLALATSADEPSRASWAELQLADAPPPRMAVPEEVRVATEPLRRRPTFRRASFMLSGAFEHYSAGTTLFGADVAAGVRLSPRLMLALRFGARSGSPIHPSGGQVDARALVGGLAGAVTLTPPDLRVGLDSVVRLGFMYATFTPSPDAFTTGREASDWAILAEVGPQAWISLVPALRLAATALLSLPLRPVQATDGGASVTGIGGVGVAASLDLVGMF